MALMDLVADRVRILHEGQWCEDMVFVGAHSRFMPKVPGEMLEFAEDLFLSQKNFEEKIGVIGGLYSHGTPFENMRKEMREELGISAWEMGRLILLGIAEFFDETMGHVLSFLAVISLTSEELLRRQEYVEDKEGDLFFLDADSKRLREYLKENHRNINSPSFAIMVLGGRHLWGEEWPNL